MDRKWLLGGIKEVLQDHRGKREPDLNLLESTRSALCSAFCSEIGVHAVPEGIAVSTPFSDASGDLISFYVVENGGALHLEDDGEYLSDLVGLGIPIDQGQRGQLLEAILAASGAFWDKETLEIRTTEFEASQIKSRVVDFMSSLIRVRDLEFLTREVVRSTFKEDVALALTEKFEGWATIEENSAPMKGLSEFPVDIVVNPSEPNSKVGAIYCVNSNEKLTEALLLQMEVQNLRIPNVEVIALLEDIDMKGIRKSNFQRAQNRDLSMPIFRGDEEASVSKVARALGLPVT